VPKSSADADAPGPGAYKDGAFWGPSRLAHSDSTKNNAPIFTIRGREKFGAFFPDPKEASFAPGPGTYHQVMGTGLALSGGIPLNQACPARVRVGNEIRFSSPLEKELRRMPGPGTYNSHVSSLGSQALSARANAAQVGFTQKKKTDAEDPAAFFNPGPDPMKQVDSVGKQVESGKESAPGYSFSRQKKFVTPGSIKEGKLPGPGQYVRPVAIGRQTDSTRQNSPSCSMSGRTSFGNPYAGVR
jgi:hypothetical protein